MGEISLEYPGNPAGIIRCRMTRRGEELAHDLGIGLAIESDSRARGCVHTVISEGGMDRAPAGAVTQEKSPVDVEEDELPLHAGVVPGRLSAAHRRQSVTPRRLQMTQMKVPQRVQGYPSEARSSRPHARHSIASVAGGLGDRGCIAV